MSKRWAKYLAGIAGGALAIFAGANYAQNSQLFMPSEYKTLRRVVNRLATKNDLGNERITFTIAAGSYTRWMAEELNLCKEDDCTFYSHLNPFKTYHGKSSKEINEAIRQSYLLNGIEGWAWSHGVIYFSRSTFSAYEGKDDYFACTLGHELTHFLNHDTFKNSLREGREGKDLKEEKRELLKQSISRESESKADINAVKMVINIGYPRDTCLKGNDYLHYHEGIGEETKKDSSHPGYEDRRDAISEFLKTYKHKPGDRELKGTKGKWKYNRKLNTLTFTPFAIK